jgi:hypothetical protein
MSKDQQDEAVAPDTPIDPRVVTLLDRAESKITALLSDLRRVAADCRAQHNAHTVIQAATLSLLVDDGQVSEEQIVSRIERFRGMMLPNDEATANEIKSYTGMRR